MLEIVKRLKPKKMRVFWHSSEDSRQVFIGRLQGTPAMGLLAVSISGSRLYVSDPLMDLLNTDERGRT